MPFAGDHPAAEHAPRQQEHEHAVYQECDVGGLDLFHNGIFRGILREGFRELPVGICEEWDGDTIADGADSSHNHQDIVRSIRKTKHREEGSRFLINLERQVLLVDLLDLVLERLGLQIGHFHQLHYDLYYTMLL